MFTKIFVMTITMVGLVYLTNFINQLCQHYPIAQVILAFLITACLLEIKLT